MGILAFLGPKTPKYLTIRASLAPRDWLFLLKGPKGPFVHPVTDYFYSRALRALPCNPRQTIFAERARRALSCPRKSRSIGRQFSSHLKERRTGGHTIHYTMNMRISRVGLIPGTHYKTLNSVFLDRLLFQLIVLRQIYITWRQCVQKVECSFLSGSQTRTSSFLNLGGKWK